MRQIMCDVCEDPRPAIAMTTIIETGDTQAVCDLHLLASAVELILTAAEDNPQLRDQVVEQLTLSLDESSIASIVDDTSSRGGQYDDADGSDVASERSVEAADTSGDTPSTAARVARRSSARVARVDNSDTNAIESDGAA